MQPTIITYTYAYQPEGGIVENFLGSEIFRHHYENEVPVWLAAPLTRVQVMDLIDAYTRENDLNEDQRADLVQWFDDLESDGRTFVAIVERY